MLSITLLASGLPISDLARPTRPAGIQVTRQGKQKTKPGLPSMQSLDHAQESVAYPKPAEQKGIGQLLYVGQTWQA